VYYRELVEVSESTYIFVDMLHLRCWPCVGLYVPTGTVVVYYKLLGSIL
jgi:hypothetical protein